MLLTIMAGCGGNKKSDCQKEDSDTIAIPVSYTHLNVYKRQGYSRTNDLD